MLSLKTYGVKKRINESRCLPQIKQASTIPHGFDIDDTRFSMSRKKINPLFRSINNDYGRYLDFLDVAYISPKRRNNKECTFTKTFKHGNYEDTSLSSMDCSKSREESSLNLQVRRREEMKQRYDQKMQELEEKKETRRQMRDKRRQLSLEIQDAVITIQRYGAGYIARKRVIQMRFEKRSTAAKSIQKFYRERHNIHLAKYNLWMRKRERKEKAIIRIQREIRKFLMRAESKVELKKRKYQREVQRKALQEVLFETSATKIQSVARGALTRRKIKDENWKNQKDSPKLLRSIKTSNSQNPGRNHRANNYS